MRIAVVGAGSWGTALAIILARNGHEVQLLGRTADEMAEIRTAGENTRYLPEVPIPRGMELKTIPEADPAAQFWLIAVPSRAVREVLDALPSPNPFLVLASKGLDPETGGLLSDVLHQARPGSLIGALSGPNLATEVVKGIPTAALSACSDEGSARVVCEAVRSSSFRAYYADDLIGVELAGALKNVLAIAAGMSDGLGYGDNTKGALLARGLREMVVLGKAMGAQPETFFGIAGVGDLFATASSRLSRNYRVGHGMGAGRSLPEILSQLGQVAEGVDTARCVARLANRFSVELPILQLVARVLAGELSPRDGVGLLMDREPSPERLLLS